MTFVAEDLWTTWSPHIKQHRGPKPLPIYVSHFSLQKPILIFSPSIHAQKKKTSWILHHFKGDGKASHWGEFFGSWLHTPGVICRDWETDLRFDQTLYGHLITWNLSTVAEVLKLIHGDYVLLKQSLNHPIQTSPFSLSICKNMEAAKESIKIRKQGGGGNTVLKITSGWPYQKIGD